MQFKFIKHTTLWFILSGLILALGVGAMIFNQIKTGSPLKFGIDFTGGSLMEYRFETASKTSGVELKDALNVSFPEMVNQVTLTGEGTHLVQAKDLSEEELGKVNAFLKQNYGPFELLRFTSIGPKIGNTLKQRALLALALAMGAIVLYITYAFRHVPKRVSPWRFGWCALIALFHDALSTIGIIALLNYEVDALFITALLTVIGFSVHDTIVVFDRIRENLKFQGRDDTFGDIADRSLNQTIARSINTSLTTIIMLTALYIFGAPTLRHFVFALIFGITVGTYSSIFIASPLLTWWQEKSRIR